MAFNIEDAKEQTRVKYNDLENYVKDFIFTLTIDSTKPLPKHIGFWRRMQYTACIVDLKLMLKGVVFFSISDAMSPSPQEMLNKINRMRKAFKFIAWNDEELFYLENFSASKDALNLVLKELGLRELK